MSTLKSLTALTELVQFRIAAVSKQQIIEPNGNVKIVEASIFEPEDVQRALNLSLSAFNMSPPVTYLKFTDEENMDQLSDLLVTYAAHLLLTNKALVEKGREYSVKDNGIEYEAPQLGNFLLGTSDNLYRYWYERVRVLKTDPSFFRDFIQDPDEE